MGKLYLYLSILCIHQRNNPLPFSLLAFSETDVFQKALIVEMQAMQVELYPGEFN